MTNYTLGKSLLKIDNVCLEYNGKPVLKNVNAEIKKIIRPGEITGQVVGFLGPSGIGKCLAKDTGVLMFDGSIKKVQDIKENDKLMGPDSLPRTVLALGNGTDEMYEIEPIKGTSFTVNKPHILALILNTTKKPQKIEISVEDFLNKSNWFKSCCKLYRTGVEFEQKNLLLNPYYVGLWLGDGDSDDATITTKDKTIVDFLKKIAFTLKSKVVKFQYGDKCPKYRLTSLTGKHKETVKRKLKQIGILNNKHIPSIYKCNSRKNRLQLLAGLIDSDGHYNNGCFEITFKLQNLANDVCYLARSLGFAAYSKLCIKSCQTGAKGKYYRIIISGDINQVPTKLARKKASPRRQNKNHLVTGFQIIPKGKGQYFGFQLDKDGLFLISDFTVTHNTQLFRIIAGLNSPISGQVIINGNETVEAGKVGVVAQSYPLFEHRTVLSNLILSSMQIEKDAKAAKDKVLSFLEEFDLADKAYHYPAQLSGGQRQRCAIIQQVLCSEHFLLMDEPFSGLDLLMLEKTCSLINKIANKDDLNTIIIVTHDIVAASSIADHLWLMGRDKGPDGNKLPGSRIVKEYNLIDRDLCWHSEITRTPQFSEFVREIREEFKHL